MFLFIDTADNQFITLALANGQGEILKIKKIKAAYKQAEKLLPEIEKLIKEIKKLRIREIKEEKKEIEGVIAVKGPGSFTGLRVGLTAANVLAWAKNVPVVGVQAGELTEIIIEGVNRIKQSKKFKPVMPAYGAEPKITIKTQNAINKKQEL